MVSCCAIQAIQIKTTIFNDDIFGHPLLWLGASVYLPCLLFPLDFTSLHLSVASRRLRTEVPSPRCLREELLWLQQDLSVLGSPVVLCHNDLLCKNIIFNKEAGEYKLHECSRTQYYVTELL